MLVSESLPILYTFRRCPYAIRARMALKYAGVPVIIREIDLKKKPAQMLVSSPKGTVPVLVHSNGEVYEESIQIVKWALSQVSSFPVHTSGDSAESDKLILKNDDFFKSNLDAYKYGAYESKIIHRDKAVSFLVELEHLLSKHRFLMGEEINIEDIAIFPFVRQFSKIDLEWFSSLPYTNLKQWLSRILVSSEFEAVMIKFPIWDIDSEPLVTSFD